MILRSLLSAAATLAVGIAIAPAPVLAAPESASRVGEAMRDPANQQAMASAMSAMSDALLEVPIAPFLRAMEAFQGRAPDEVDPDLRLRDFAGPEAERVPREMSRRLPGMMDAMGDITATFEAALPALAAAAKGVRERLDHELRR